MSKSWHILVLCHITNKNIQVSGFYKSSYKMTNLMLLLEIREELLTLYNLRFMNLLPWLIMSFWHGEHERLHYVGQKVSC
jgi:hypothetical protein